MTTLTQAEVNAKFKDSTQVSREEIEAIVNVAEAMEPVDKAIEVACQSPNNLVRFIGRYASLNSWFGSNVAAFAGRVGRSRGIFLDPGEEIHDLADRSVLVASYFFDAARDEFDDRDTPHRDTHRCLAQAMLKGMITYLSPDRVRHHYHYNDLLDHPVWLRSIGNAVEQGYGARGSDLGSAIFRSMGYHVGSEVLADLEFSHIDAAIRQSWPEIVEFLSRSSFPIAGQMHNGYAWISIHSGHGASKEVEHFNWAVEGVEIGLKYVPPSLRDDYRHQVHLGVSDFVRDHREFFDNVSL